MRSLGVSFFPFRYFLKRLTINIIFIIVPFCLTITNPIPFNSFLVSWFCLIIIPFYLIIVHFYMSVLFNIIIPVLYLDLCMLYFIINYVPFEI